MPNPRVSVIMPTCDRPQLLRRAVASVLAQTEQNLELIVINDGGTEVNSTLEAFNDARIRLIDCASRRGQSTARNTGLKAARGEYVAYLDDDDSYYPEHLATLLKAAQAGQAAYSDAWRVFRNKHGDETGRDMPFCLDFDRDLLLIANYIPLPCLLHARSLLESSGLFDEELSVLEDWDLLIRLARCCDFVHVRTATAEYNKTVGLNSVTRRGQDTSLEATEIIHERYQAWADAETRQAQLRRSAILKLKLGGQSRYSDAELSAQLIDDGEACFAAGALEQARFFLESALGLTPANPQALNDLGVLAWQQQEPAAAVGLFLKSLESVPGNPAALANLRLCQAAGTGLPDELRQRLTRALESGQD